MAKTSSVTYIGIEEGRAWYGYDNLPVQVVAAFQRVNARCKKTECRLYYNPTQASQFRVLRAQELAAGMKPVVHRVSKPRDEAQMGGVEPQPAISVRRIDELLEALDAAAREFDSHEFGLPIFDDGARADMQMEVLKWMGVVTL